MDLVELAWQRCTSARPELRISLAEFRAFVGALGPDEPDLCFEDLYLACGVCARDPEAVRVAERELVPIIELALSTWDVNVRDETTQRLRAMLLVDHAGRGPLLSQYKGKGVLKRWVRVVAVREAGKVRKADLAAMPVDDDTLFDAIVPPSDPRLSAVKRNAAVAFRAAFVAALGTLEPRDRTLLRLHVVDELSIDEIAPVFEVHRATAARWIAAAKDRVLADTRKRLASELRIDLGEVDSLIRIVQSRIELPELSSLIP